MIADANKEAFLKSGLYKEILSDIATRHHPAKVLLPLGATMEQRALQQIRSEEFERIMAQLGNLAASSSIKTIESTYGIEELPKQKL